ncbi:GIY-YIG nuclease family protein [Mangrovicoccus ximenensis]|uniref:hypothetical protein n=1 Tax=Mangrovicoccus ximenensis TaxID=1911570 RepID=UPI000D347EFA|nr:hypothetical protein [Mangrovicoccus ximenensis]
MPRRFSRDAFEHLLFPLHPSLYAAIEGKLAEMERLQPGLLDGAAALARVSNAMGSRETFGTDRLGGAPLPRHDLRLIVVPDDGRPLRKTQAARLDILPHAARPAAGYTGCHLIVTVVTGSIQTGHILPLGYALRELEDITLRPGGYQIYRHHLYPSAAPMPVAPMRPGADPVLPWAAHAGTGLVYTGLTSRSWAKRLAEHRRTAHAGSGTLFHQALRGTFFPVAKTEHEILRAGVTRAEAMRLEEIEIEDRSLFPIHARGLNMIPGGEAGMKFIAQWRRGPGAPPEPGAVEEAYDAALKEMLAARLEGCVPDASAIARLWAENLAYRIGVTCGRGDRLSQLQITFARIWHACGWSEEKIAAKLDGVDRRRAKPEQVRRLLAGKTYADVPNLMPGSAEQSGR